MKYLTLLLCAGFLAAAALPAYAAPRSTETFVKNATVSNLFEILSSKQALEKSQNGAVKEFAEAVLKDHEKVRKDMKAAMDASGTDAVAPMGLDERRQQLLDRMQKASGPAFDKQFIAAQSQAHDEAVDLFSTYSRRGEDRALTAFAAATLPMLKQHQAHIKTLNTTRR